MIYKKFNIQAVAIDRPEEESSVPCGDCHECCIKLSPILTPDEFITAKYVYTLMTSPDPGTPVISIPRNEKGCYYLNDNKCTVYNDRPKSCKQFDCRKGHFLDFKNLVFNKFGIELE
jgi:Fe-S-cluster containining protein